jgi:hypothetical protein
MVSSSGTVNWKVSDDSYGSGRQLSISTQHGFTLTSVINQGSGACASTMQAYGVTTFWSNRFEQLDLAAKGGTPRCFE